MSLGIVRVGDVTSRDGVVDGNDAVPPPAVVVF
jgi:hypothetical protein